MDWSPLLTPVIIALIPILVAGAKKIIPAKYAVFYPMIATALGPMLDWLSTWITGQQANPKYGLLMGMAAVALREIIDQAKKTIAPK